MISGWFFWYLAGLQVVWLVYGQFVGGVASLQVDCGWFVDGLAGLYVVWVVCMWFG